MFKDVQFAEWGGWVAIVAFAASLAVFLYFVVMALRMSGDKVRHDASLPLNEEKRQ